jgi:hypothetical protein
MKTRLTGVKPDRSRHWTVPPMQQEQDHLLDFIPHRCRPISGSPTSLDRAVEHKGCFDRVRLGPLALQRFVQRRGEKGDPHGSPFTWRNRIKL